MCYICNGYYRDKKPEYVSIDCEKIKEYVIDEIDFSETTDLYVCNSRNIRLPKKERLPKIVMLGITSHIKYIPEYANLRVMYVNNAPIKHISNLPLLEQLTLRNCQELESLKNLPSLSELQVYECGNMRTVQFSERIQRIDLSGCPNITEISGKCFPELIVLSLKKCSIRELPRYCPKLKVLECTDCMLLMNIPSTQKVEEMSSEEMSSEGTNIPSTKKPNYLVCKNCPLIPESKNYHKSLKDICEEWKVLRRFFLCTVLSRYLPRVLVNEILKK